MADTNQNLVSFRLLGTLSVSWTEVTVSNDILRDTAIAITDASITLTNEARTSFELVVWTIATWTLTLSKRGIKQDQTLTEDATLKKEWRPWTIGYVTLFASDTLDIDNEWWTATIKNDITFTWDNTFSWTSDFNAEVTINNTLQIPTFADTNARDVAYSAPVTWNKCIINWVWEQYYEGWAWNTLWVWSPTPNASETVAGKIEMATQAEFDAWTTTWATTAPLFARPDLIQKQISTASAKTTMVAWDSFGISDSADSWKIKRLTLSQLLATSDAQATDLISWVAKLWEYSDTIIWTNNIDIVTPKVLSDLFFWKSLVASSNLKLSADTERTSNTTSTLIKIKEIALPYFKNPWTISVSFDLKTNNGSYSSTAVIYKNWISVWTSRTTSSITYINYIETISVNDRDLIQLYYSADNQHTTSIRNFRISYDEVITTKPALNWAINLN